VERIDVVRDMHGSTADRDVWNFIAHDIYPFHMDPWFWGKLTFLVLVAMAAVNTWYAHGRNGTRGLRLLAHVELACAIPTVAGVVAWAAGRYEFLRFFPFRVFPIVVSLGFALTAAYAVPRWWAARENRRRPEVVVVAIAVTILLAAIAQNPVREAAFMARRTLREWTGYTDRDTQLADTYHWVRGHTPSNAVVIAPPGLDPHFDMERAQIATFGVPRWDDVAEWKRRILAQLGPSDAAARRALDSGTNIDDVYRALTPARVRSLHDRYGASYFITDRQYPFGVAAHVGPWTVYRVT
jgi:hypothetical protein